MWALFTDVNGNLHETKIYHTSFWVEGQYETKTFNEFVTPVALDTLRVRARFPFENKDGLGECHLRLGYM